MPPIVLLAVGLWILIRARTRLDRNCALAGTGRAWYSDGHAYRGEAMFGLGIVGTIILILIILWLLKVI